MPAPKRVNSTRLPGKFEELVRLMPPRAIKDDRHYADTTAMVDRLMASGRLTKGQELYMETLVQLVEAHEARHHALKHLLAEHGLNASALAKILGMHESMGSKILNGDRSLTVEHIRTLASRFKVRADIFLEPARASRAPTARPATTRARVA
jgi:antitoxin component HigA of HigAB toxin-antitoxin module